MVSESVAKACVDLIRQLLKLVDQGESIEATHFIRLTEEEHFVEFLLENYEEVRYLHYLDRASSLYKPEVHEYFNDAMHRHANVVTMEDHGLRANGFLFAVNIALSVLEETFMKTGR